jgi:hypothetical protein
MSNTGDVPEPDQPGAIPPEPGSVPPVGPGQPGRFGGFRIEWPADRPRNFRDALPLGGYSGILNLPAMPTELKISYWVWVIGGLLGLLAGVIGLFGTLVLFVVSPPAGILLLLLVLVAVALAAAQVTRAMKMKEGWEWARFALTIAAGVSLVLALASIGVAGGGSWPGFVISLVATVLMWLPKSQAWFDAFKGRS